MKDLSSLKILVVEWTKKAQNLVFSDDERNVFYECAERLHDEIHKLELFQR